jgi:hypothetical protein
MQFALLIIGDQQGYDALTEDQTKEMYAAHERFGSMLAEHNALAGGAELAGTPARVVRPAGEGHTVTDGPYAETAESIGGWYLVEAADLDAATELAKAIPVLPTDLVEVRKVVTAADR